MSGKEKKFSIGRAPENDLVISDDSVSRKHAELVVIGGGQIFLTDCKSSNGTFVIRNHGPEKVNQMLITPEDTVAFGDMRLSVREIFESLRVDINKVHYDVQPEIPLPAPVRGDRLVRCLCGAVKKKDEKCRECGR